MQPTGQLHLGNYEGALKNWVSLQDKYRMYLCVVDWHALTSDFDDTAPMQERIFQTAVDYLAAGLDPEKCSIFVQSDVKEHAELHLLFSMIIPIPWLERVPSYKEKVESRWGSTATVSWATRFFKPPTFSFIKPMLSRLAKISYLISS